MPQSRLDLGDHRTPGVRVFSGRERGKAVRGKADLDRLDARDDFVVDVIVPHDVVTISSSFFLGLFGASVRKLGEVRFRERFRFLGLDISEVVSSGITEALNSSSPL
jgi:hypothetical protein